MSAPKHKSLNKINSFNSSYRKSKYRPRYRTQRNPITYRSNRYRSWHEEKRSRPKRLVRPRSKPPKRSRSVSLDRKKKSPIKPVHISGFVKSNKKRSNSNSRGKKFIDRDRKKSDDGFQIVRSRKYRKKKSM